MWSDVSALSFSETTGTPDIEIRFVRGSHGDGYPFDGPGSVLAHAYYPYSAHPLGGDEHYDDDETWTHQSYSG